MYTFRATSTRSWVYAWGQSYGASTRYSVLVDAATSESRHLKISATVGNYLLLDNADVVYYKSAM